MSLTFVAGSSGSGKSTLIYNKIIEEAGKNPDRKYLVIVPEQYTMATQRLLVELHPAHCIMNIDVLSFNRLAYRVFGELGLSTLGIIEDTGKNLVLRSLVPKVDDRLTVLRNKLKRPGYITQLKSLISEMTQYQITPEILKSMIEHPAMSVGFKNKAKDLCVMYEAFLEYTKEKGLITTESVLTVLDEHLDDSALVVGSTIVLDGFTGFTPIQYELFSHMLKVCDEVFVTLTIDETECLMEKPKMEELFSMSKNFACRMSEIAKRSKVELKEPIFCDGSRGRLKDNAVLSHLESNLFRSSYKKYKDEVSDNLEIRTCQNTRAELEGVAVEIQKLIRAGMNYKDVAVVCTSLDAYRYQVPEIFDKFDIPYFVDSKSTIVFHPILEAISALFEIEAANFNSREVIRFLRCGFTDLTSDEIDLLENYLISTGIRGRKKYFGVFAAKSETFHDPEEIKLIDDLRLKFIMPFIAFDKAVGSGEPAVRDIAVALYQFLAAFDVENKNLQRRDWHEQQGHAIKAKEYSQIFKLVMDLLDKMVAILGEETMSLRDFYDIFEAGMNASAIGVIPPANDSVVIGDMERTRLGDIKVLFLLGANDTSIPKPVENGGILSQFEREQLIENDFELAPTDKERAFIQKFYLYLILTKPSQKLFIYYPAVDGEGKEVRKSYLVDTLLKMFPELEIFVKVQPEFEEKILSENGAVDFMLHLIQKAASEGMEKLSDSEVKYLYALLEWNQKKTGQSSEDLIKLAFNKHENEPISEAVREAINEAFAEGGIITGSVSRLETYAGCGYRYFLQYILGLREREEYALSPIDIGNFYHAALELFGRLLLEDDIRWHDVDEAIKEAYIEKALTKAYESMPKASALDDAKQAYIFDVVKETLRFGVDVLLHQVKKGGFEPAEYESVIKRTITDSLTGQPAVVINGKVDRIDMAQRDDEKFVRIIDYKSSAHPLDLSACYHGLSLQLPIYMGAVVERLKVRYPDFKISPSGLMYYQVDNPYVTDINLSDESLEESRRKLQRLNGLIAQDNDQIHLHDSSVGDDCPESDALKISVKKGGVELNKRSSMEAVDEEGFNTLIDFAAQNAVNLASQIKEAKFDCSPSNYRGSLNCNSFCPFKAVCHFNEMEEGFSSREMPALSEPIDSMKEWCLKRLKGEESLTEEGDKDGLDS